MSDGSADSEGWHVKRSKQPVKAAKKPARKAINSDSETSSSEEESIDGSEASDEFLASDDGVEEIAKPVRRSAVLDQFLARKSEVNEVCRFFGSVLYFRKGYWRIIF